MGCISFRMQVDEGAQNAGAQNVLPLNEFMNQLKGSDEFPVAWENMS